MLAVAGAAIVVLAGLAAVSLISGGHPARARAAGTAAPLATYPSGADPNPADHPAAGPAPI